MFDVDGCRFGCAICIEVNFPVLFSEYERLGVDCVLLSAWPVDGIFLTKARAHAAINCYWLSAAVRAQSAELVRSTVIGPDGGDRGVVEAPGDPAVVTLDRRAPEVHVALDLARPWRASANRGDIFRRRWVDDPRSTDRTCR